MENEVAGLGFRVGVLLTPESCEYFGFNKVMNAG